MTEVDREELGRDAFIGFVKAVAVCIAGLDSSQWMRSSEGFLAMLDQLIADVPGIEPRAEVVELIGDFGRLLRRYVTNAENAEDVLRELRRVFEDDTH